MSFYKLNDMNITNKIININFDDLDDLDLPLNSLFELKVDLNNVLYEFLINIKPDSDKLIVLGSGTLHQAKLKEFENKPYYNRWSWNYNETFICYNDPSRYLNNQIQGLWGIGVEEEYYLENIKEIILKITSKLNIYNENILFYGSSMGGFMSLMLATMIKKSIALADIPQFNLINYRARYWRHIKKYSFNGASDEYICKHYGYRINFTEMMKKEKYIPNAYLLLDYSYIHDIPQYSDFFGETLNEIPFNENGNKIKVFIYGKGKGHNPLPYEETMCLINNLLNKNQLNHNLTLSNVEKENSLSKYLTARFDIINIGNKENSLSILNNSDENALISYPDWFNNEKGKGMIIHSTKGKINLILKCCREGELLIRFRGKDVRDKNGKRLPIYINFTNIYLNNKTINETEKIVCHDNPYTITKPVKDSEIITISASWNPF